MNNHLVSSAFLAFLFFSQISASLASVVTPQTPLDGRTLTKFLDALPQPPRLNVGQGIRSPITITASEFHQQILPSDFTAGAFHGQTTLWGYNQTYPGPTLVATRSIPISVQYVNILARTLLQSLLTIDQTLHWADPLQLMCVRHPTNPGCRKPYTGPIPMAVHLHGGEVPSAFDGHPEAWFTAGTFMSRLTGPGFVTDTYTYPNQQQATTLWYHDHNLGVTRLDVFGGLAGFYFLRDPENEPQNLPEGSFEREIVIQDRQFDSNGQVLFPDGSPAGLNGPPPNPSVHPFWNPEFFGDVIVVNGKAWPYLNVEPRRYRFRLLNGSNARMYELKLEGHMSFWQIGTDGGYLDAPVEIDRLFLAPGERADVVVDFSDLPEGTTVLMTNHAKAPFPHGAPPDPQTTGQIMQFRIVPLTSTDTSCIPSGCQLRKNPIIRLAKDGSMTVIPTSRRMLILKESEGPGGPLEVTLNNTKWMGIKESTLTGRTPTPVSGSVKVGHNWVTELPRIGSTEEWDIVNTTEDAHPIHLHLVQFQLINRQAFMANAYLKSHEESTLADGPPNDYQVPNADGAVGGNFAIGPYLHGRPLPPDENETGWKDTVVMLPGTVTRLAVRWAPQSVPLNGVRPGQNRYSFDPTAALRTVDGFGFSGGPGYVWHCHILDHEDNEMMRPIMLLP